MWILEKEIQRVKAEKSLPYGEARRLVTASSPSKAPSSYAIAVKSSVAISIPERSVECQTPDFWLPDTPSLLELSKKPSILTQSTASGTNKQVSPMNKTNHKEQINKTITQKVTKKAPTVQNKQTKSLPLLWLEIKELPRVDRARNPVVDDKIKTFVSWWY